MLALRRHNRGQRGAAAVEFALTVPLYLAILGGTVYFGLALYAKFLVVNAASTALRNCVIKQVGFRNDGDFKSCATSEFSRITGGQGYSNLTALCSGSAPVVSATFTTVSYGVLSQSVKMLTLNVSCQADVGAITYISGPGGVDSATDTKLDIKISSSMPYSLNIQPINN